jgi:hypothetical protein
MRGYSDGLHAGELVFDSLQGQKIFVYFTVSGPPPQWVPGAVSWGKIGRGVKLTTHLHPVPKSRMVDLYLHSPICLNGMCLINQAQGQIYLLLITKL